MTTITGAVATLRWGYQVAASLQDWTVTAASPGGRALSATVVRADTFRVSQRPLVFVAPHAKGAWTWPILALQIQGALLTATLGPKET